MLRWIIDCNGALGRCWGVCIIIFTGTLSFTLWLKLNLILDCPLFIFLAAFFRWLHISPVPNTDTSFLGLVGASFVAADGFFPVLSTETSFLDLVGASFMFAGRDVALFPTPYTCPSFPSIVRRVGISRSTLFRGSNHRHCSRTLILLLPCLRHRLVLQIRRRWASRAETTAKKGVDFGRGFIIFGGNGALILISICHRICHYCLLSGLILTGRCRCGNFS
mmetsp:Transcript_7088/g.16100  ORF Transcript_7088/g.16100 Transcript_7088/m.16100 type:complete len:221 (+) Transcript_7088:1307-1969(+)